MNGNFLNHFKKIIEVEIRGKNIERMIRRITKNNIDLLRIYKKDKECIHVFIYSRDFELLENIKTVYEVSIIKNHGILYFYQWFKANVLLFIFLMIGSVVLLFLSNMIFSVDVIHTDKELRNLLLQELEERGISKYHLKKNYDEITVIKKQILEEHKTRIEWLEIEEVGTKYVVRVEERILNQEEENLNPQNIVAKKSAIIYKIDATAGQVVKGKLDYVHPGDVIISGNITLNEEVKKQIAAKGTVYGEVWYKVSIEYPLHYEEVIYTNDKKKVLSFHFFNFSFDLFNLKKYKQKQIESKILISDSLFPIYFSYDTQREVHIIDEDYTVEEATEKALLKVKEKIESQLSENEYILSIKKLKVEENKSTIILDAFVTVYEDITDVRELEIINENQIIE